MEKTNNNRTRIIIGLIVSGAFCASQVKLMMRPSLVYFILSTTIFLIVVGVARILFKNLDESAKKLEGAYTRILALFECYEDELLRRARTLGEEPNGSQFEQQMIEEVFKPLCAEAHRFPND